MNLIVDENIDKALNFFKLPEILGFGQVTAPIMIECDYFDGVWGDVFLRPYGPISLSPTAKVFHYAQEVFEGMKGYYLNKKGPFLFRPIENFKRFNHSCIRMGIPQITQDIYMGSIIEMVKRLKDYIPQQSGSSLYIRPFVFATQANLGIKCSNRFKFMVVCSPSGAYFSGELTAMIERYRVRAVQGGTGAAKTGGNYAASLMSNVEAVNLGYLNTLWLDAKEGLYVEEMSGMNFFAVVDGVLTTPPLSDTILAGITRDSLLLLAKYLGLKVSESKIHINSLIEGIKSGAVSECFACGTAAIITPIKLLGEKDKTHYRLKNCPGPLAMQLREKLLSIQEGTTDDPLNMVMKI